MLVASLMFPALFALVLAGIPIAFSLALVAAAAGFARFGMLAPAQLYGSFYSASTNFILAAIPMFVLMGAILERSGIAERLFKVMQLWMARLPNGLAIATIAMGAVFAAAAGVVGAVEVMIGMMAIPAMQRMRYDNSLIAGTICAGGSLGTMIPPSVIAVMYASLAQMSVGELLAGMMLPGLLMVALFVVYILVDGSIARRRQPVSLGASALETGSAGADELLDVSLADKLKLTATSLAPIIALIVAVLGSLLAGIASPTEAAAVGAVGALILSIAYRRFSFAMLRESLHITVRISAMILLIVAAGTMFMGTFAANGGSSLIRSAVAGAGLGEAGMIVFFLLIVFLLGFVLDWTANVLICVPLFTPFIRSAGIDPVWFGTLVIIVIQTSYLTPPMASSIFYLKSIAPSDMTYGQMCRGVVPFILLQVATLLIVALFPALATWLPSQIVGF
ncbi:TRAP transporter, DctM subunit [Fulvimarina manganoxydans]|uniref:TRAP transporter large permease protein n=1 Tax=Fulvimarina manganoxydans TaxID=937218 RepID=A0A1W2DYS2_9HYPH|nr:TRAP transporter large permease subunit [Fulvimarina manganoxydans]SMD02589.1 TRAP transporter, DctM subunit [Fulvimarina manganoxydans]